MVEQIMPRVVIRMLDIIKEGIKLNQSLALLPLKAVRKLVGDKNSRARQMVDVAEDIVGMPFIAAAKAIDNSMPACKERNCQAKAGQNPEGKNSAGGPSLRNMLVNPEVTVVSDAGIEDGQQRAVLKVTGLLCGG